MKKKKTFIDRMLENFKKETHYQVISRSNGIYNDYEKKQLKELTEEEINYIHSKGMIIPEEILEEWDNAGICAPSLTEKNVSDRCKNFSSCRSCLINYLNKNNINEYASVFEYQEDIKKSFTKVLKKVR